MAEVGFKRLTIRVHDSNPTAEGTNLFTIEGKANKGATQTAKISGLSADAVKSHGSDVAYYVSRKGVGDVKVALTLLDVPNDVMAKILGYTVKNGITLAGADTEAPYCSILLESTTTTGEDVGFGFFKGTFSKDDKELETIKEKVEELKGEQYDFTAIASDSEDYKGYYYGKLAGDLTKLKQALGMA